MFNNKPILLVEDDLIDTMITERALKENEVFNHLVKAENGEEALEYLQNSHNPMPCFILLDLNMPKMNGLEFLSEIKKDDKLKSIPVIVLTTSHNENDIKESFSHSVAGYIIKPIDYNEFVKNIQTIRNYWEINQLPA
jgi:CheY-like chemotaxis protein